MAEIVSGRVGALESLPRIMLDVSAASGSSRIVGVGDGRPFVCWLSPFVSVASTTFTSEVADGDGDGSSTTVDSTGGGATTLTGVWFLGFGPFRAAADVE